MIGLLLQQHQAINELAALVEKRAALGCEPMELRSLVHGLLGRVWVHLRTEQSALSRVIVPRLVLTAAPELVASLDAIAQRWDDDAIRDSPLRFREELEAFIATLRRRIRWEDSVLQPYCDLGWQNKLQDGAAD